MFQRDKTSAHAFAQKLKEDENIVSSIKSGRVDPYAVLFWTSITLMLSALVLGVVVGFM